jgi:hypothetical protein
MYLVRQIHPAVGRSLTPPLGLTLLPATALFDLGGFLMMTTRRTVLARGATSVAVGIAAPSILAWSAGAAEFAYKYGTALPEIVPLSVV